MISDRIYAFFLIAGAIAILLAYGARLLTTGPATFDRVSAIGAGALLGPRLMNAFYWALQPVGNTCIRLGITANAVTTASVVLGAACGVSLATGRLGLAALLSLLSSSCDALDGLIARRTKTASETGEVFDAAADRYAEFFFLGGVIVYYSGHVWAQAVALAALLGSSMVSYSSAKAESFHVIPPRGSMRRPERAAYLTLGLALTPLAAVPLASVQGAARIIVSPLFLALILVAGVANASAIVRLFSIGREVEARKKKEAPAQPEWNGNGRTPVDGREGAVPVPEDHP
ncbi:MAG: CDP-alcohol phosphatidyltransferase family protein [Polyangiaceae bacterium]